MRKPGAFARYVYREEMFPSLVFRRAYDAIQTPHQGTKGDLEYLRILHLAASTIEADVEAALTLLFDAGQDDHVRRGQGAGEEDRGDRGAGVAPVTVDLAAYDALLAEAWS